jgi:glycosyltransferase involved in cell wall biosynthesis
MPSVSVIIPVFNRARTIERALTSVLSQSFTDWEIIVVDDGSSDDSAAVCKAWLEQHAQGRSVFLQTSNRGVSSARNLGVAHAQSEWLAFLDSDDEWLPLKLDRQMILTEAGFAWIHGEEIWIRHGVRVNPMRKHAKSGGRIFKRCVDLCCVSPSAALIRKKVFETLGPFREDFPVCEDYDLWLKFAARFEAGFITKPVVIKYGGHDDQLSRQFTAMDYFRCKSLIEHLDSSYINEDERLHLATGLVEKCDILVKGYNKHGRTGAIREIANWRDQALRLLTANHKAHSVTVLRPRSDSTEIL